MLPSIAEFSRVYVPVIALFVSSLSLVSLFLLWWQVKKTVDWNKLSATRDYYKDLPSDQEEKDLQASLRAIKIDPYVKMTEQQVEIVFADFDLFMKVKFYLNKYEVFCSAVSSGMIEEDFARDIAGDKVVIIYNVFQGIIERQRATLKLDVIWIEIEKFSVKWQMLREADMQKNIAEMRTLKLELGTKMGTKKKY